jgi:rod shape-determining protein MreC
MYRKQVRRRRVVLVVLVVACLMLISISISEAEDGPLHSIQNGVSSVLSPIQEGADRALKPGRDLVNWFDETFDARGENEKLKSEVADLREEMLDQEKAIERAGYEDEVAKLLDEETLVGYEPVDANISQRSFTAWYSTITVSAGESDGVSVDDAVVSADGLVGMVTDVFGGSARVKLITDGRSAVTAQVAGGGAQGLVEAVVGSPGELDFGLIQGGREVEDGDKLITAGFSDPENPDVSSRFPPGIPIGEVTETIPIGVGQQQEVRLERFADLDDLDQVTILTGGDES